MWEWLGIAIRWIQILLTVAFTVLLQTATIHTCAPKRSTIATKDPKKEEEPAVKPPAPPVDTGPAKPRSKPSTYLAPEMQNTPALADQWKLAETLDKKDDDQERTDLDSINEHNPLARRNGHMALDRKSARKNEKNDEKAKERDKSKKAAQSLNCKTSIQALKEAKTPEDEKKDKSPPKDKSEGKKDDKNDKKEEEKKDDDTVKKEKEKINRSNKELLATTTVSMTKNEKDSKRESSSESGNKKEGGSGVPASSGTPGVSPKNSNLGLGQTQQDANTTPTAATQPDKKTSEGHVKVLKKESSTKTKTGNVPGKGNKDASGMKNPASLYL